MITPEQLDPWLNPKAANLVVLWIIRDDRSSRGPLRRVLRSEFDLLKQPILLGNRQLLEGKDHAGKTIVRKKIRGRNR